MARAADSSRAAAFAAGELAIGLSAVIVAVTEEVPLVLVVNRAEHALARPRLENVSVYDALPFGPLDPSGDRTLERALRGWVRSQTGFELGYAEQLYTFGDRDRFAGAQSVARHQVAAQRSLRVVSVAYFALVREAKPSGDGDAHWRGCYEYLPWEDWRKGRPAVLTRDIEPALEKWSGAAGAPASRRERVEIAFGLGGSTWDPDRVLDRYELLYECGLVAEAAVDRGKLPAVDGAERRPAGRAVAGRNLGRAMAFDHRRILATALGRLRGKLRYRPVVFELLPPTFTLLQLQRVVEALAGVVLHKQNFRRLVETGGLVEGTGRLESNTGGRPAELFRFRREVLRERPAPGVGIRGTR